MPAQKPITNEPEPVVPAKWKSVLKRVMAILGLILSLSLVYVFLLMGEPDEDSQLTAQTPTQEETIRVPMAAAQMGSDADLNALAASFGKPVLALYGSALPLQNATLFDTAFHGGYARRLTLQYTLSDGAVLVLESIRPTAAIALLGSNYRLNINEMYTLSGLDALRMDSDEEACIIARSLDVVYAIRVPKVHGEELSTLVKQASLMQPTSP